MKTSKFGLLNAVICYLLISCGCVSAQKKEVIATQPQVEAKSEIEQERIAVQNLINDAQSQQGEIAADALIRLAISNKAIASEQKIKLLDDAFQRASEAQNPIKIKYAGVADTPSGLLSQALELNIDKLSLQSRIVKAMLTLDKKKARQMFSEISPKMTLPSLGCKKGFIFYDVDEFYRTLDAVLAESFTEREKKQNAHIFFALQYIESINSPAQITPVIKTILSLKPDQLQLLMLTSSFTKTLKNITGDDNSFRASMSNNSLATQIINLRKTYLEKQLPEGELLNSFRSFLLNQINGVRCSNGLKLNNENPLKSQYLLPGYLEFINSNLLVDNAIKAEDIQPSGIEEAENSPDYFSDASEQARLRKYEKLHFNDDKKIVTETEKENTQWQTGFSQLLIDAAAWSKSDGVADNDYFHQKCSFFQALLEIAPKNNLNLRVNAFREYLSFVSNSQMRRDNRAEWLLEVHNILDIAVTARGEEQIRMINEIVNKNDSTLRLFLKLKQNN
jgi:outer membrane murein-binding lipoprotein Lpp